MDDLAPRRTRPLSCPSPVASEDYMSSLIIGVIFIVGGLSGQLALVGTNSGTALAVVGALLVARGIYRIRKQRAQPQARSEEHTSELQSHSDLVCRLLLEKKKQRQKCNNTT